jgi:5-hydroxyisourate hydrolase
MSGITTHVLDTARGQPAVDVSVTLQRHAEAPDMWVVVGRGRTDTDGRLRTLLEEGPPVRPGVYRLLFDTGPYFAAQGRPAFYPRVAIEFEVADGKAHYHVPLLVSPFGYTTYRGS